MSNLEPSSKRGQECTLLSYNCYYCDYCTDDKHDYQHHTINKHGLRHPCYPSGADIDKLKLKPQDKEWEK
jgi:hypothetical protein